MERDSTGRFQRGGRPKARPGSRVSRATIFGASSLVTGLAIGAVAMYLLDSKQGAERRAAARDAAQRALQASGDAANSLYQTTSNLVGNAANTARQAANTGAGVLNENMPSSSFIRDHARGLLQSAGTVGSALVGTAGGWADSARQLFARRTDTLRQRGKLAVYAGVLSTTAVSALAVGAAAMWVFDPDRGRARRAWMGQKSTRFVRDVGDFASATGRHFRDRGKGYYFFAARKANDVRNMIRPNAEDEGESGAVRAVHARAQNDVPT